MFKKRTLPDPEPRVNFSAARSAFRDHDFGEPLSLSHDVIPRPLGGEAELGEAAG
jgi:hypothetical protein